MLKSNSMLIYRPHVEFLLCMYIVHTYITIHAYILLYHKKWILWKEIQKQSTKKTLKSYFLNATRNFSYLCQFLFNWPSYAEKKLGANRYRIFTCQMPFLLPNQSPKWNSRALTPTRKNYPNTWPHPILFHQPEWYGIPFSWKGYCTLYSNSTTPVNFKMY